MEKNLLSSLIHLVKLGDNLYLKRKLEQIQEIINTTPNNYDLGEKLRKVL